MNPIIEKIKRLEKENEALKNRCAINAGKTLCFFCNMECKHRKVTFRKKIQCKKTESRGEQSE